MARKAGIEWKAVGASLNGLAATMRTLPAATPGAFAYAGSGVLQQAGVVFLARYVTPENHMDAKGNYTAPPGATHGPVKYSNKDEHGELMRNAKGQFIYAPKERKVFVKGKFVSRSGLMRTFARELAATPPTDSVGVTLAHGVNARKGGTGDMDCGIDREGRGYLLLDGGYAAAEKGQRGVRSGVRGWWSSLRSVQGRWGTLLKKKYPDLLKIRKVAT